MDDKSELNAQSPSRTTDLPSTGSASGRESENVEVREESPTAEVSLFFPHEDLVDLFNSALSELRPTMREKVLATIRKQCDPTEKSNVSEAVLHRRMAWLTAMFVRLSDCSFDVNVPDEVLEEDAARVALSL